MAAGWDFKFAFDNEAFSDKTLVIVMKDYDSDSECEEEAKRRRIGNEGASTSSNRTIMLKVNSALLAAKSSFFNKMFSVGMREREQREIRLQIRACDEDAFLEMIKFIYTEPLTIDCSLGWLHLLTLADKYGVESCITCCVDHLNDITMTTEFAIFCVEAASSLPSIEAIKSLIDEAKDFLIERFKHVDNDVIKDEFLRLPPAVIHMLIASPRIEPISDDSLYNLVRQWLAENQEHMDDPEDIHQDPLKYICFQKLSWKTLQFAVNCSLASTRAINALLYKAKPVHLRKDDDLLKRNYRLKPVQGVIMFEKINQCVVFLEINREELQDLSLQGSWYSEYFYIRGRRSQLVLHRSTEEPSHPLCLSLGIDGNKCDNLHVEYELACREMPLSLYYYRLGQGSYTSTGVKKCCMAKLQWDELMEEHSRYLIDNCLCLRLTVSWDLNSEV